MKTDTQTPMLPRGERWVHRHEKWRLRDIPYDARVRSEVLGIFQEAQMKGKNPR